MQLKLQILLYFFDAQLIIQVILLVIFYSDHVFMLQNKVIVIVLFL